MLTIKFVYEDGKGESVREVRGVSFFKEPSNYSGQPTMGYIFYEGLGEFRRIDNPCKAYVMNEAGKTIANYEITRMPGNTTVSTDCGEG